jgi:hypothetical protein
MPCSILDFFGYHGVSQQLDYFGRTAIARLLECCRKLLQLNMDQRAWRHLFRLTGWDIVPNSARTILQEMTLFAAAKQMASWRMHGSCSLSPTLAGLCTHAALIQAGFDFQTGDADVGAGEARKLFFHQRQGDRSAADERVLPRLSFPCGFPCGNVLAMPLDCRVTSRIAELGFGRTSHNVNVSFRVCGYQFALSSRGKIDHTAEQRLSVTSGRIQVNKIVDQIGRRTAKWQYMWWVTADSHQRPTREEMPWPLVVHGIEDSNIFRKKQLSNDVRVHLDSLDKFVLAGFAGQLRMCGGPSTQNMCNYGVLLLEIAAGLDMDDTSFLIPFWAELRY